MRDKYKTLAPKPVLTIGSTVTNASLDPMATSNAIKELQDWAVSSTRSRGADLADFNIQTTENPRIFAVPTSSTDIVGTEKAGDVATDASFLYIAVDNAGAIEWRRGGISSF